MTQELIEIGLTATEAETYLHLLAQPPSTGYRVAQALGRPAAQIYKTLESLEAKGAVLSVSEDDTKLCRAVPIDELLDRIDREFQTRKRAALAAVTVARHDPIDDRVYRIARFEQLYERCAAMIRSAESFVLLTACPAPLARLADDLTAAAARGLRVGVKVFEPAALPGVDVVVDPRGMAALQRGPGQWLMFTADGREYVTALFSDDGAALLHGAWSCSALLSWNYFTGLSSDFILAAMRGAMARGADAAELTAISQRYRAFESPTSAGKQILMERYTRGRPTAGARADGVVRPGTPPTNKGK